MSVSGLILKTLLYAGSAATSIYLVAWGDDLSGHRAAALGAVTAILGALPAYWQWQNHCMRAADKITVAETCKANRSFLRELKAIEDSHADQFRKISDALASCLARLEEADVKIANMTEQLNTPLLRQVEKVKSARAAVSAIIRSIAPLPNKPAN